MNQGMVVISPPPSSSSPTTTHHSSSNKSSCKDRSEGDPSPDSTTPDTKSEEVSASTSASAVATAAEEDLAAKKEQHLRAMAVRQMTQRLANKPNGTTMRPPIWYRRPGSGSGSGNAAAAAAATTCANSRPLAWIKDWDTGKIRPRVMMDDFREIRREKEKAMAAKLDSTKSTSRKRKAAVYEDDTDSGCDTTTVTSRLQLPGVKRRRLALGKKTTTGTCLPVIHIDIASEEVKGDSGYDADDDDSDA